MPRRPPSLPPPSGDAHQVLGVVTPEAHRVLGWILNVLLLALPAMFFGEWLGTAKPAELTIIAAMCVWIVLLVLAHRKGRDRLAMGGLLVAMILAAALFGVSFGSVRSVGAMAFAGAIVVAGIFFDVRALVATLCVCSAVVGGLIAAQNMGWLPQPSYDVTPVHWFEYTVVLGTIAMGVWFARRVAINATERALADEARLAAVLRNAPFSLVVSALDGSRILEVNAAYERTFRLRREDAVGRTSAELALWTDPAQRSAVIETVLRERRVVNLAVRLRRADGEEFDALLSSELVDSAGQQVRVTTVIDVSAENQARRALEASEARFRRLFDETPVAALITTYPEGRISLCNDAFADLVGRTREALAGHTVVGLDLWHDAGEREEAFARLQREGIVRNQPLRVRHTDGALRHCLLNWVFMEIAGERFILGQMVDVTARLAAEQALRDLAEGLEARVQERTAELAASNEALAEARDAALTASEAKSRFVANVSHEIRTPLNAIVGLIDLTLRSPELAPSPQAHLRKARQAALALLEIINSILDFSKIEAGRLQIAHEPFDLDRVLESVQAMVGIAAADKGLALRIEVPAQLPRERVGDALRLTQVLVNLAGNAVKFTASGGVTIEAGAAASAPDGIERIRFAVHDSGIGIAPGMRQRLFEPFTQIDSAATRRFGGTGLGLAISRELVRAMGGEIEIESEQGKGSSFIFTLALPCAAQAASAATTAAPDGGIEALRGRRILLAEDNELNQLVARGYLEDLAGATLRVVSTGAEALDALRGESFDLVLMDVQMPVMDGYEATRRLRLDPRHARLPVIAMTAHAQPSDRERSLAAGMNGHLTKPLDARELFATLAAALGPVRG
ncbi:MAG TPA: PAS domain S-box protein [Burkholderiaceae bacterium]|nr:PAS domain S-box protein [Burkholderiaceae bacterium]